MKEPQCTVCNHPDREEIEKELLSTFAYRKVARDYGLSKSALFRHAKKHMGEDMERARDEWRKNYRSSIHRPPVKEYQVTMKPGQEGYEEWAKRRDPFKGQSIDDLLNEREDPETPQERKKTIDDIFTEYDRKLLNEFPVNVHHGKPQWPTPIRKRIHYK